MKRLVFLFLLFPGVAWANEYYNATGAPSANSSLSSSTMRAEFALIEDAFDKYPTLSGNGSLPIFVNSGATALEAISAASARTNLGLVIGTNVQAYDADLTTWAGITPTAFAQSIIDDTDEATFKATVNLEIGTDVQAYSANMDTDSTDDVTESDVDDTPANGATTDPVSSNWAYDHEAAADPHTGYALETATVGIGQTWQDVGGTRGTGVNYTNSTGKPISVSVTIYGTGTGSLLIGGSTVATVSAGYVTSGNIDGYAVLTAIVPNGVVYRVNVTGTAAESIWYELR